LRISKEGSGVQKHPFVVLVLGKVFGPVQATLHLNLISVVDRMEKG
jgi:hypothetical protein